MLSLGRASAELPGGLQLGPYVIESLLGAGGMGQVYRARDERLKRPVAVKILPAAFASDPDRMRRFEFEARAAGALSHPNILVVHDVGRFEDRPFIVEELLEGQTLRDRLRGRYFAPQRAVEIARQIANGLAAAHAKGIVHRDLKPSNVFLSRHGSVKILDFGLAKLRDPQTLDGEPDTGSTAGLLGTVGYLSPEQARGEHADHRADVFSLGCVLYEMLTGRKAFGGASSAEILAATLTKDPPSVSLSVPDVPPSLSRVVHRCMEKEPEDRFSSAHDLSLALESTQDDLGRCTRWWRPTVYVRRAVRRAVTLVFLVVAIVAMTVLLPQLRSPGRIPEFSPRQMTSGVGLEAHPAISPDGRDVAYAGMQDGNTDIWIADVQGGSPLRLTSHRATDESPAWFPDGSSLAFVSDREGRPGIWKVDRLGGGSPTLLVPNARDPALSPDGGYIAFARPGAGGYHRIAVAPLDQLDSVRMLTPGDHGLWDHGRPAWSPDGTTICYQDFNHLWLVSPNGGAPRRLTAAAEMEQQPVWSPDGRFLYFSSIREGHRAIWRRRVGDGPPTRVTMGPDDRWPSLSLDGRRLLYATVAHGETLVAADSTTGRQARFQEARRIDAPAVAPDGSSVVFVSDRDNRVNFWRLPLGDAPLEGVPQRVTDQDGKSAMPRFSRDGRWIAYYRTLDGQRDVWTMPATGGPSHRFTDHPATDVRPAWSPDGSFLGFVSDRDGSAQVWVAAAREGRRAGEPRPVTRHPGAVLEFAWSPDGRRIAYLAPAGNGEVWLTDVSGEEDAQKLTEGADARHLRWPEATGRLVVLGRWSERNLSVRALDPATGALSPIPHDPITDLSSELRRIDVTPDGRWLVVLAAQRRGDVWLLEAREGSF